MSLNTCTISGNLGKAAELRYTNSQLAVVSFSVAVNERRKQADGSYQDEVNWLDCTMFGKRAEALQPYLAKGTKLSLTGHLHKSTYERDGKQYSRVEIIVDEVELMNARREAQAPEAMPPQAVEAASVYDSDIPF
ncbi:single-stranded DNA-binding protein [uncultured Adlercreutzia sp.]|jgi:single-strand DNA-binding protein|uniref:single-stranded DNA-binding protein n=1 Tax=uncultured Adlercreutzia sp. TaxID=875803 RepID=UPI002625EA6B|nr:single-stranded DNA-binding protein [uncultured Adlercreutzia sp.]